MNAVGKGELLAAVRRQSAVLESLHAAVRQAMDKDVKALGRSGNSAVMVAGLLDNYYTCLETAFLRISQFFENNLSEKRWHTDLLEKMTLSIEGIRIPAVSAENYPDLLELLKFRHFRRYYFELQYDWDRLDFLIGKFLSLHPRILADLGRFLSFVEGI